MRLAAILAFLFFFPSLSNAASPPTDVYLLIGQSNMVGIKVGSTNEPQPEDMVTNPQITVLGYATSGSQVFNTWSVASPPLHAGGYENGVGIGDSFSKEMLHAEPTHNIALVPCGFSGADIDFFSKGVTSARRKDYYLLPDNKLYGAYPWIIKRAKLAQKVGRIRAILFHQGESDYGKPQWSAKVAQLIKNLRTDLGLGDDVPVLIGDLGSFFDKTGAHNSLIKIACQQIPNAHEISSDGLVNGGDNGHFSRDSYREFGRRYAAELIALNKEKAHFEYR